MWFHSERFVNPDFRKTVYQRTKMCLFCDSCIFTKKWNANESGFHLIPHIEFLVLILRKLGHKVWNMPDT